MDILADLGAALDRTRQLRAEATDEQEAAFHEGRAGGLAQALELVARADAEAPGKDHCGIASNVRHLHRRD